MNLCFVIFIIFFFRYSLHHGLPARHSNLQVKHRMTPPRRLSSSLSRPPRCHSPRHLKTDLARVPSLTGWSPRGLQQLILLHLVTTFNVRAEEDLRTIRLGNCKHLSNKDGEVIYTLLLPKNTEMDTGGGFVIGLKIIS